MPSEKKMGSTDPSHLLQKITIDSELSLSSLPAITRMNESEIEEIISASFLQMRKCSTEEQNANCERGHDFSKQFNII